MSRRSFRIWAMQEKTFKVQEHSSLSNSPMFPIIFAAKLDAVKTYMSLRRVPNNLEDRVIRWLVTLVKNILN